MRYNGKPGRAHRWAKCNVIQRGTGTGIMQCATTGSGDGPAIGQHAMRYNGGPGRGAGIARRQRNRASRRNGSRAANGAGTHQQRCHHRRLCSKLTHATTCERILHMGYHVTLSLGERWLPHGTLAPGDFCVREGRMRAARVQHCSPRHVNRPHRRRRARAGPQQGKMKCDTTAAPGGPHAAHGTNATRFIAAMGGGPPMVQAPTGNGAPTGDRGRSLRSRLLPANFACAKGECVRQGCSAAGIDVRTGRNVAGTGLKTSVFRFTAAVCSSGKR